MNSVKPDIIQYILHNSVNDAKEWVWVLWAVYIAMKNVPNRRNIHNSEFQLFQLFTLISCYILWRV